MDFEYVLRNKRSLNVIFASGQNYTLNDVSARTWLGSRKSPQRPVPSGGQPELNLDYQVSIVFSPNTALKINEELRTTLPYGVISSKTLEHEIQYV